MARFVIPQKMWERSLWALWIFLVCGALLWLVLGATSYWGVSERAADWAQAVGSLAAVLAALYAVWNQRASEQRARQEREAVVIRAVQLIAARAYEAAVILYFAINPSEQVGDMPKPGRIESANNALAAIKSIDPMSLPSIGLIDPVIQLGRCVESLLQIYEGKQADDGKRSSDLLDLASSALKAIKLF